VAVTNQNDLEQKCVVFPKLFRRLTAYLAAGEGPIGSFPAWLAKTGEQVLDLSHADNFTHFDNLVRVQNDNVSMALSPSCLSS
jgi:hypothetical protein